MKREGVITLFPIEKTKCLRVKIGTGPKRYCHINFKTSYKKIRILRLSYISWFKWVDITGDLIKEIPKLTFKYTIVVQNKRNELK